MALKSVSVIPPSLDANGNLIIKGGEAKQSISVQSPTTGFNITIANNTCGLVLTPAGTLASGTITMPSAPIDKQIEQISSSQAVTSLTVAANAGQSILNAPTTINPGQGFGYIYNLPTTTWIKLY